MKTIIKILLSFLIFSIILNCATKNEEPLRKMEFIFFEMMTPKNWKKIKMQGIDSYVGAIKMDNNEKIYYDYGYYSNKLIDLEKNNKVIYEKIGGLNSKIIISGNENEKASGIYFDSIRFVKEDSMRIRLQFSGRNLSPTNEKKLLKSFRTLKFKK